MTYVELKKWINNRSRTEIELRTAAAGLHLTTVTQTMNVPSIRAELLTHLNAQPATAISPWAPPTIVPPTTPAAPAVAPVTPTPAPAAVVVTPTPTPAATPATTPPHVNSPRTINPWLIAAIAVVILLLLFGGTYVVVNTLHIPAVLVDQSVPAPVYNKPVPTAVNVNIVSQQGNTCTVVHDYDLIPAGMTELATSNGFLHVEYYVKGQPEFEVVLPSGRYSIDANISGGHVWEYKGSDCTLDLLNQQVAGQIARRLAQHANNGGYGNVALFPPIN